MDRNQTYRVVVGVDFSESGHVALHEALALVRDREGAELHVVHAATNDDLEDTPRGTRLERLDHLLRELPARLWESVDAAALAMRHPPGKTRVSVHVRVGSPSATIHQVAVDYDADIIVIGTHGRRGLERMILGSVAADVVRRARSPVLVARTKDYRGFARTERPAPPLRPEDVRPSAPPYERHVYTSSQLMNWAVHNSDTAGPTGIRMF